MVNKTDLDDKASPGTPLDPAVIAAMANSLGYEPEVNDPMSKQDVSSELPEAQALEALPAINESQAVEWQRPKHLHTIQEWQIDH